MSTGLELESMALEMPVVEGHPNRRRFRGVLTTVNVASDRAPSGARGHRVMLTAAAVEAAIPSLLGMAVDYTPDLDGHDARRKVGIITAAELSRRVEGRGQQLDVSGYLFEKDFPEIVAEIGSKGRASLGMSYEIADVRVVDAEAAVWVIREFTFTGAAVLRRSKAAYGDTCVELA
jgi:hypothetical protein